MAPLLPAHGAPASQPPAKCDSPAELTGHADLKRATTSCWQLREDPDMKRYLPIAVAVASIVSAGQVMAAEMDMSKATCKEVGALSAPKTIAVALWVNGYVHGKAGNPVIDSDKAQANAEKVADYCRSNPDSTLANAIEALAK